jgi:Ca2+-binding EF-hand superfamily protein
MGCGSSSDAAGAEGNKTRQLHRPIDWAAVQAKLPVDKDEASKQKRMAMFDQFDPNKNGYLSLAEIDKGMRDVLGLQDLFDAKPVLMRAYQAAKGINPKPGRGEDYVERAEFRMLLVYLKAYLKIWEVFSKADSSDDRRLDRKEFAKAFPTLQQWAGGLNEQQVWDTVLPKGAQHILFTEFAQWAIEKELKNMVDDASAQ